MTNFLRSMRLAVAIALSFVVSSQSMGRLAAAERVEQLQEFIREANAAERPGEREALRAEIQRLQDSLGGPQVDRFPSLRAQSFGVPAAPGRFREGRSLIPRDAIRALRDAAAELDVTANRLEQLELFMQADSLRQQAQRLRLDARQMSSPVAPAEPSQQPTPAQWFDPAPGPLPDWNRSMPQLRPSPDPRRAPVAPPGDDSPPALEPVPQPEIPSDPPNPQPLLDSPESTPQPDVEVEG